MRLGIRGMLAFGLFGLLATAGGVAAVLTGQLLGAEAAGQVQRQQRLRALELSDAVAAACASNAGAACEAEIGTLARAQDDDLEEAFVLLADLNTTLGTSPPCARRDPLVLTALQTRVLQADVVPAGVCGDAERFVVVTPIRLADGRNGVARYAFDPGPLQAAVASRRNTVLWGLLADFGAVLAFGIYLVGRNVVRPLQALTRTTELLSVEGLATVGALVDRQASGLAPYGLSRGASGALVDRQASGLAPCGLSRGASEGPEEIERLRAAYGDMLRRLGEQSAALREKIRELSLAQDSLVRSEKLATVGRLAAGIAHEVGNPLTAVLGFLEYLRDDRGVPPELQRELLGRMDGELNRIRDTIRQLLDFSRPLSATPQDVDVGAIATGALDLVRYHPKLKPLTLRTTLGAVPPVRIDPERLRQVVVNLLLNAGDALSGRGEIDVSTALEAGTVVLAVRDDGPGLDDALLARVFDPFVTTKPAGEGTGLGLAICQRLIEEAGGTISARRNENGRGACFEVRLPPAAMQSTGG